jgi:hypothetical protein
MKAIGDKEWNYGSNRKDSWVGAPVAKGQRMTLDTPAARKVIQATVEHLHKLGHITIVTYGNTGMGENVNTILLPHHHPNRHAPSPPPPLTYCTKEVYSTWWW